MTDYSPSALRDLMKKMAHKAIETTLYMPPSSWDGSAEEGFGGAGWDGRLPPVSGPTGTVRLKYYPPTFTSAASPPPGAQVVGDGTDAGGQPYYEYEVDPWTSIYEPWISRIETAFEGWDSLPEPGDYDGPLGSVRSAVSALTPLPTSSGGNDPNGDFGTTYSDVELESALGTMGAFVGAGTEGAEHGLLVYAFREGYGPDRIRSVMGNQGQVAVALGVVLLAEQRIWKGAQHDIMAIADAAVASFRPGGAGGDSIDLEVVKAFANLVGDFVPAPLSTVIKVGTDALDVISAVMPEPKPAASVQLSGYTCDEVYDSLCDTIKKLEQRVFDQEFELAYTTLSGVVDYMQSHDASQFHINPGKGVDTELAEAAALDVKVEYLKKVGYDLCPSIAAYMGRAAESALAANRQGMWVRANQIGLGTSGPYDQWSKLQGMFDQVTTGSGHELVEAGRLLAVGAGYLEDTDGDSDAALTGVKDDLDRGKNEWDNRPPPVYYPGMSYPSGVRAE